MNAETGAALLFFSGIIAFVPELPEPNVVHAYLINVAGHDQRLRVPLNRLENQKCPDQSGYCKEDKDEGSCDCDLKNNIAVSISTEVKSTKILLDRSPGRLPDPNKNDVGKIDWLVNMWSLKPGTKLKKENIPKHVRGQISFNWTDAATCRFEEALCDGERRIYAVKFDVAMWDNPEQAVPELVVFKSESKSGEVTITLYQGATPKDTLKLKCPSADPCPVLITNVVMGLEDDSWTLCKDCGESKKEGEHFREYRRLTNDPFGVPSNRLCKNYARLPNKQPELCKALDRLPPRFVPKAISNRVICPSAILTP